MITEKSANNNVLIIKCKGRSHSLQGVNEACFFVFVIIYFMANVTDNTVRLEALLAESDTMRTLLPFGKIL